jgi:hypothetical protein
MLVKLDNLKKIGINLANFDKFNIFRQILTKLNCLELGKIRIFKLN